MPGCPHFCGLHIDLAGEVLSDRGVRRLGRDGGVLGDELIQIRWQNPQGIFGYPESTQSFLAHEFNNRRL